MPRGGKRPGAGRKPGQRPKADASDAPLFIPKKGRPSAYDPAFCGELVEFCAQGFSITAYAGSIGVSRRTLTEWAAVHDEFSLAVQSAKAASAFWWEQRSRRVAEKGGGPGTATMIMFNLKNVAPDDYREKVALEHTGKDGKDLPATPAAVTIFQLPDNGRS